MKKSKKKGKDVINDNIQEKFEKKVSNKWGNERVTESNKNWNSYTKEEQEKLLLDCKNIFNELAEYKNNDVNSKEIQELMARWHYFIKNFYNPSLEVLRGLGNMYLYDPDFLKTFEEIDPDLPDFLSRTINNYVDKLEEKWIESQYDVLSH